MKNETTIKIKGMDDVCAELGKSYNTNGSYTEIVLDCTTGVIWGKAMPINSRSYYSEKWACVRTSVAELEEEYNNGECFESVSDRNAAIREWATTQVTEYNR